MQLTWAHFTVLKDQWMLKTSEVETRLVHPKPIAMTILCHFSNSSTWLWESDWVRVSLKFIFLSSSCLSMLRLRHALSRHSGSKMWPRCSIPAKHGQWARGHQENHGKPCVLRVLELWSLCISTYYKQIIWYHFSMFQYHLIFRVQLCSFSAVEHCGVWTPLLASPGFRKKKKKKKKNKSPVHQNASIFTSLADKKA